MDTSSVNSGDVDSLESLVGDFKEIVRRSEWTKTHTAERWQQDNPEVAAAFFSERDRVLSDAAQVPANSHISSTADDFEVCMYPTKKTESFDSAEQSVESLMSELTSEIHRTNWSTNHTAEQWKADNPDLAAAFLAERERCIAANSAVSHPAISLVDGNEDQCKDGYLESTCKEDEPLEHLLLKLGHAIHKTDWCKENTPEAFEAENPEVTAAFRSAHEKLTLGAGPSGRGDNFSTAECFFKSSEPVIQNLGDDLLGLNSKELDYADKNCK